MKSFVQVSRFNRKSTNGFDQVILNVIDGDSMPSAVSIMIETYAKRLGLSIGDQCLVAWRETGKEEIIRAGKATGEYRPTYSLFKVEESSFTETFLDTLAVESAKKLVGAPVEIVVSNRTRRVVTPPPVDSPAVTEMKALGFTKFNGELVFDIGTNNYVAIDDMKAIIAAFDPTTKDAELAKLIAG